MADLTTKYLGLGLRNPLVASAGPMTQSLAGTVALAESGVGAVVMHSLFEEQLRPEAERRRLLTVAHAPTFRDSLSFLPSLPHDYDDGLRDYLSLIERSRARIEVPLIASINATRLGRWTSLARQLADAGADALELNVYFVPADAAITGAAVEQRHLDIVDAVRAEVDIPVAVKLSPYFSSIANMCTRLDAHDVAGLVLFNRFQQADIDLERFEVRSGVTLSTRHDARLPRIWISVLYGHVRASLAASSGVQDGDDVIKYLLAGADVVMTTSALIRQGVSHAGRMLDYLSAWLDARGLNVADVRGRLASPAGGHASEYARGGYVSALLKAREVYGGLH